MSNGKPAFRQDTDNDAHVAFFDQRTQASFTFNATRGNLVSVAIGGYGEPVDHEFALTFSVWSGNTGILSWLSNFQRECEAHAATLPTY